MSIIKTIYAQHLTKQSKINLNFLEKYNSK